MDKENYRIEEEIWAEKLLEYKDKFKEEDEFYNMFMYGTTHPEIPPNTFINLGGGTYKYERLTKEEVVEKYGWLLTEEDKKKLLE